MARSLLTGTWLIWGLILPGSSTSIRSSIRPLSWVLAPLAGASLSERDFALFRLAFATPFLLGVLDLIVGL